MGIFSIFSKDKKESLDKGLEKTRENVFSRLTKAVVGKSTVDADVLDNLEEILVTGDVGVETTLKIIARIEDRVKKDKYLGTSELNRLLKEEIASLLAENNSEDVTEFSIPADKKPYVIMVVGVNGVGKTTTIGKLANQLKKIIKTPYTIKTVLSGLRPTTKNRRPLIMRHPIHSNLWAINGFGTKGSSLGPFIINQFLKIYFDGLENKFENIQS